MIIEAISDMPSRDRSTTDRYGWRPNCLRLHLKITIGVSCFFYTHIVLALFYLLIHLLKPMKLTKFV